ncbi:unnamed protein product [Zymoseptoria tritici ST99CH_3D7]|uniref:Uncharacterized protein n=1 Tax=Zymoseptoria tritici (strain ST99CH_3D7) TaxID=1276538 RepID=A0A1X7RYZ8_ZYMT9|nr:unnamed protein product [Zymoseptoria tritici ST99CH_3D7]
MAKEFGHVDGWKYIAFTCMRTRLPQIFTDSCAIDKLPARKTRLKIDESDGRGTKNGPTRKSTGLAHSPPWVDQEEARRK